ISDWDENIFGYPITHRNRLSVLFDTFLLLENYADLAMLARLCQLPSTSPFCGKSTRLPLRRVNCARHESRRRSARVESTASPRRRSRSTQWLPLVGMITGGIANWDSPAA